MLDGLELWFGDFEYGAEPGERPEVRCLVAKELRSGRLLRLWRDQLTERPPYPIGPDALFVAYYASAELGCHLSLGWPLPVRILDLFTEFRNRTNGLGVGHSLLAALAYFGLDSIDVAEKEEMRELALRGGRYTDAEKTALLDYCQSDVVALEALSRPSCCRESTCPGRCCAGGTWRRRPGSSIGVYRSTCHAWRSCASTGIQSRTN